MRGIGQIKEIFSILPAAAAIIQADGNKGQYGRRFPQQHQAADRGPDPSAVPQDIKHADQDNPESPVIRLKDFRHSRAPGKGQNSPYALLPEMLKRRQPDQSEKQGTEHILHLKAEPGMIKRQIIGNLRYQREYGQPRGVFFYIPRVEKSFGQQETVNRKGHPADGTQDPVDLPPPPKNLRLQRAGIINIVHAVLNQSRAYMVNQHRHQCDPLQGRAAEALVLRLRLNRFRLHVLSPFRRKDAFAFRMPLPSKCLCL